MRRAAAALVLAVVATCPAAAVAKPVRCAKTVSKQCRKFQASQSVVRAVLPMVAVNPFVSAPVPEPAPNPAPEVPVADPLPAPPPSPAPARLGVIAREWSLTLSRTAVKEGPALVELQNFGEDAHNLRIERADGTGSPLDVAEAEAGQRQRAGGSLAAGGYRVYCTLPGHDAQGMHARLSVTP